MDDKSGSSELRKRGRPPKRSPVHKTEKDTNEKPPHKSRVEDMPPMVDEEKPPPRLATKQPVPVSVDVSLLIPELEKKYAPFLIDCHGNQRAAFVELPQEVISLLQGAWNLGQDETMDRVTSHLAAVQSYSPNLRNFAVKDPGFPAPIFKKDNISIHAELKLRFALAERLKDMGYMSPNQAVEFYLSFLKTKELSLAQDPHIDFQWETVQQPNSSGKYVNPTSPEATTATTNTTTTNHNHNNPQRHPQRRSRRALALVPYQERVPFVAFFPLTKSGMVVEVWKARKNHLEYNNDSDEDAGVLVRIPMGVLLMLRGDVVHAGGFMSNNINNDNNSNDNTPDHHCGDPRGHFYIYRNPGGEKHALNLSNTYNLPNKKAVASTTTTTRLNTVYKHCQDVRTVAIFKQTKYSIHQAFASSPKRNKKQKN
jgi:hypothetical protein